MKCIKFKYWFCIVILTMNKIFCPLTGKDCTFDNCRMSVQYREKGQRKDWKDACLFVEHFKTNTSFHHVDRISPVATKIKSRYGWEIKHYRYDYGGIRRTNSSMKTRFNNNIDDMEKNLLHKIEDEKEIIKEVKEIIENNFLDDIKNTTHNHDYALAGQIRQEYMRKYFPEISGFICISEFEKLIDRVVKEVHYNYVKEQKMEIPKIIDEFIEWTKERGIIKYKQDLLSSFLTIKNITIYSDLNPALKH